MVGEDTITKGESAKEHADESDSLVEPDCAGETVVLPTE